MPSPFPGMDPYIEMDQWQEFHVNMVVEIQRHLIPLLLPDYVARVERRIYTERLFEEVEIIQPDVEIAKATKRRARKSQASATAVAEIEPRVYSTPHLTERREPFIKVVDRGTGTLVALIEFLSPSNKSQGSEGYVAYHEKRDDVLRSNVNLVEIDLLRGGRRLPTVEPLDPSTDYCVFVHRAPHRGRVEVYEWPLEQPLPTIPVPLTRDHQVLLDLGRVFATVYDAAGFYAFVRHDVALKPPLRKEQSAWAKRIIPSRR